MTRVACTGPAGVAGVGDVIFERIGRSQFNWGDGSRVSSPFGSLLYLVTSIDPANNWLSGVAVDPTSLPIANPGDPIDTVLNHTYNSSGAFTAYLSSCCRTSRFATFNEHINNPGGIYRTETVIDLSAGNNSPSSVQNPIVLCPINSICNFTIPATDIDGDTISFRLSTPAEAGGSFRQPGSRGSGAPNLATIDPLTGIYTWDTAGARLATRGRNTLYSTQVMIEDGTTKVPLDFFIQLTTADPEPPVIQPPENSPPICNTTQVITLGDTLTFGIVASDPDAGDTVTLNSAGLPSGAFMTPVLPITGNPVSSTFSWTPDATQVGNVLVSFSATSSSGGFSQCPVTLQVVAAQKCDVDGDNNIDRDDISLIFSARNTPATDSSDPRDVDKDNVITVLDARQCVLQCDLTNCQIL
ncbi:MAG: hypothetical protein L3J84_11415 [Gammaproteobacteria bacterium]|nr:hypothetical protein [Gammaproteobacteria bacterium]